MHHKPFIPPCCGTVDRDGHSAVQGPAGPALRDRLHSEEEPPVVCHGWVWSFLGCVAVCESWVEAVHPGGGGAGAEPLQADVRRDLRANRHENRGARHDQGASPPCVFSGSSVGCLLSPHTLFPDAVHYCFVPTMEEDEDVSLSDFEIEDLMTPVGNESKGGRGLMNARNEALDASRSRMTMHSRCRVWI